MNARKSLPPLSNADPLGDALRRRYAKPSTTTPVQDDGQADEPTETAPGQSLTPADETDTPARESSTPVSYTPHTRRRAEPPGMTRRTYYLPTDIAEALDGAVARLRDATGGRATKHEALALILTAGCGQVPALAEQLRAALLAEITRGSDLDTPAS